MAAGRLRGVADDPRARVAAVVAHHERTLLRVARQWSLCHDDALDAYQRALEIFVRRVETVDPATEVGWLKVVVRHEAMAIRRSRTEAVGGEEVDLDTFVPAPERSVEEQIASSERVSRSAEALRALKPDEAQALMMKAHGLSYDEIGRRQGWTYTKVNRAITEGRRRFMRAYEGIESGEECERFAPTVEALAAGTASAKQLLAIRPHLRHCLACRAAVRELHLSRARRALLLFPLAGSAGADRIPSMEDVLEVDAPPPAEPVGLLADLKQHLVNILNRFNGSDLATGIHLATSGGGRASSLAAVIALCVSSLTAGTVCVVTGVLPDPLGITREEPDRPAKRTEAKPRRQAPDPTPSGPFSQPSAELASARPSPTPAPTATPRPKPERSRPRAPSPAEDPAQGTAATSHQHSPISPAAASGPGQETFTPESFQADPEPAAAPATGGTEFAP